MAKNIIKEIALGIAFLVAAALLLAILLWGYNPSNVVVPVKVQAYELKQEVKEELKEQLSMESQNIIKSYTIDSSDLSVYEYSKSYDKGKADPFTSYKSTTGSNSESGANTGTGTNNTGSNTSTSNNSENGNSNNNKNNNSNDNNTTNNSSSTGTFFNNTGKS